MIFRLFSTILLVIFALLGTVAGNALRMLCDKTYKRHRTSDTDGLIITAVISNSLIAAAIAFLFRCAIHNRICRRCRANRYPG